MINIDKIEEWLREVEERPSSAAVILRYIANRLSELTSRNEELLADNIELRSGRKVEEYESRIANLEYQVELLKRQVSGEIAAGVGALASAPAEATFSVLIYNVYGQMLRVELKASELVSGNTIATLQGEAAPGGIPPRLLATSTQEELLFVFDSGRSATLPVGEVSPTSNVGGEALDWEEAFLQEPRGVEELVTVLPVAKMSLYESCIQSSRKGYVKKVKESFFEAHVANGYVGTGVRLPSDKTCDLTLCNPGEHFVLVSQEGYLLTVEVERVPLMIEEAVKLGITDHIVAAFSVGQKPSILMVTHNGKALHRDAAWLEPASSFRTKGQPAYSKERREAGVRLVGAAPVDEDDWGVALSSDGKLRLYKVSDIVGKGALLNEQEASTLIGFTVFR
jgi:DNA gyrase/topoisomerase IV subunit A